MSLTIFPLSDDTVPCGYFTDRLFTSEHYIVDRIDPAALDGLLYRGYRHFGRYFFRPRCSECRRCIPIRVRLENYAFSSSARRLFNRNSNLRVEVTPPNPTSESFKLYTSHGNRFDGKGADSWRSYVESFFPSLPGAEQISLYAEGRLVGVMHFDDAEKSLSAVYSYYDDSVPKNSLGTFAVFSLIRESLRRKKEHLYLGYYIEKNRHMRYKVRFTPNELSPEEGTWLPYCGTGGIVENSWIVDQGFRPVSRLFPEIKSG